MKRFSYFIYHISSLFSLPIKDFANTTPYMFSPSYKLKKKQGEFDYKCDT